MLLVVVCLLCCGVMVDVCRYGIYVIVVIVHYFAAVFVVGVVALACCVGNVEVCIDVVCGCDGDVDVGIGGDVVDDAFLGIDGVVWCGCCGVCVVVIGGVGGIVYELKLLLVGLRVRWLVVVLLMLLSLLIMYIMLVWRECCCLCCCLCCRLSCWCWWWC